MDEVRHLFSRVCQQLQFSFFRKVPQVLQTEAAECGLACIVMVCRYFGMNIDLLNLRQKFGLSTQGATLATLVHIGSQLNLQTRALSLDLNEIRQLRRPCLLHWDMSHFVVLVKAGRNKFTLHDPAFGRRVVGLQEMSQHFTGIALELWPDSEFKPIKARSRIGFWSLLKNISGLPGVLAKIFAFTILVEVVNIAIPIGTQLVMDHVIIAKDRDLLTLICLGLVSFILFRTFISMLRSWTSLVMQSLIDVQWKTSLMDHLLRLPLSYFEKRKLGDIQSRFGSLATIRETLTSSIISGTIDLLMVISVSVMMFMYGGWLYFVVLAFTLLYAILRFATYHRYRQAQEEQIVKDARASSHFMETLYGIATLKVLGLNKTRSRYWLNLNIETTNAVIRMTRLDMLFGGVNSLISTLDQVLILWLGASMVIDGHMTLGMFVAFNAYRGQFSERASAIVDMVLELRMLSLHNERVADIVYQEPESQLCAKRLCQYDQAAKFEVEDLSYQYDKLTPPILSHCSFSIECGESVAIVGPSGVGKTTLMKLMCGLLTPDSGNIRFNGLDITQVGLNNFRDVIACVLQEDKLFAGSIAENIMGFGEDNNRERIIECASMANLHEEIISMPMGYETLVSELGGSLSGGQKQRLLIARALYRRPAILFLDEATSHLDLENETVVNAAIRSLNITRIFIAHRPSTIATADRIIDLTPHRSVGGM